MRHFTVKITKDKRFWAVLYTLMALLAVVSVYEGIKNGIVWSQDFQYDATTALTRGYDPYDLSVDFDEKALPDILKASTNTTMDSARRRGWKPISSRPFSIS